MTTHIYTLLVFLITIQSALLSEYASKITINQGTLQGSIKKTLRGRSFLAYQGIPYAEPPIGENRFKPPVPLKSWHGILNATGEHSACAQDDVMFRIHGIYGDEDCLFLNVYTPKISPDDLLPVIVFIHGGGFMVDHANPSLYGPGILLDKNVVFATINYRLGAFGFLSTEDDVVPGNNGLKDQNLALRWIKNNVKHFGGNPDKITIYGQSAGGASVYYHLLSPLSKDLVYAGISSSGIAVSPWALGQRGDGIRNAKRLAMYLRCPTTSNDDMVDCMRKVKAEDIVIQSGNFFEFLYEPGIPFKPVIEHPHKNAFLSKHPVDIIKDGEMADVPFMTGVTTDDGAMKSAALYNDSKLVELFNTDLDRYLSILLNYDHLHSVNDARKFSKPVRTFYLKDKDLDNSTKSALTDMVTDAIFLYSARRISVLHAKYSKKPVYFFLFGYRGSTSTSIYFGDPEHDYGVAHCDDLTYVLTSEVVVFNPNEDDYKMVDLMTTMWYNFASTGNPTPNGDDSIPVRWDPVSSENLEYYYIKNHNKLEMQKNLYEERYQFWKNLGVYDQAVRVKDEL